MCVGAAPSVVSIRAYVAGRTDARIAEFGFDRRMRSPNLSLLVWTLVVAGCSSGSSPDAADETEAAPDSAASATLATTIAGSAPSPDDSEGRDGTCAADALPTLCLDLTLTGAVEFAGALTDLTPSALDCGAWAAGGQEFAGPEFFSAPALDQPPPDGPTFTLMAVVDGYRGPGSYDVSDLTALGSPMAIIVDGSMFEATDLTTGSVTVDADGAGSLTVTGLAAFDAPEPRPPVLDVSLRWTCTDPAG
jgi:hypothetical protein